MARKARKHLRQTYKRDKRKSSSKRSSRREEKKTFGREEGKTLRAFETRTRKARQEHQEENIGIEMGNDEMGNSIYR